MESTLEPKIEPEIDWDDASSRLRLYLRAWKLPADRSEELFASIMDSARASGRDPARFVIEEVQRRLGTLSQVTREPDRPMETHPRTMETSLSRLPSFRIIVGWFALIALLGAAFALTH